MPYFGDKKTFQYSTKLKFLMYETIRSRFVIVRFNFFSPSWFFFYFLCLRIELALYVFVC